MEWIIPCFLILLMQAGFALMETGLCRAKNAAHTMSMNFLVYALGITAFWAIGFALMYGGAGSPHHAAGAWGGHLAELSTLTNLFGVRIGGHWWGLAGGRGFFPFVRWPRPCGARHDVCRVPLHDAVYERRRDHPHRNFGRAMAL